MLSAYVVMLFAFSSSSNAALNLKPGLWELSSKMEADGKGIDPQASLAKAMAKMPPEKRKQMEAMMAKSGLGVASNGARRVCFTEAMFKDPGSFSTSPEQRRCETKIKQQSSTSMEMEFSCKDGASGVGTWKTPTSESFTSHMEFKTAKGRASNFEQSGKFLAKDCGDVKPLIK